MELDLDLGKSTLIKPIDFNANTNGALFHSCLGHPGCRPFSKAFPGVTPPSHCDPCILSKHHQLLYQGKFKVASERMELIHSNLSGIITPPSLGGSRYYFKRTNSCTSFKFVYLLLYKSQTLQSFIHFKDLIENETNSKIKAMINDNGGKYTSSDFKNFIKPHGIRMHLTAPYTPQQNPVLEIGN